MATKPPFLDGNTTSRLGERTAREDAEREDTTGDTTAGQDEATDDGNADADQHLEFGESGAISDGAIRERVDDDQLVNVPDDDVKGSEGDTSTGVRGRGPPRPPMGHPVSKAAGAGSAGLAVHAGRAAAGRSPRRWHHHGSPARSAPGPKVRYPPTPRPSR